jgi:hypothetical protein
VIPNVSGMLGHFRVTLRSVARPRRVVALAVVAATSTVSCSRGPEADGDDVESAATAASPDDATPATATAAATTTRVAVPTTTVPVATTTSTDPPSSTTSTTSTTVVQPTPTTTSCTTVAHIGDSTSVGLFEPAFMPDPGDALPAQYERVGVLALYTEVSGGRSTIETIGGEANAFDTVVGLREMGYRGCWVITIGTNDAANVAIGGVPDLNTRLDRMMFLFGSDPVLWVDAVTLLGDGPYADTNMQTWNQVLDAAEARFPTLRLLRWSEVALDEWFVSDGIHYTSVGSAWRSRVIADALVAAFPAP